jgi:hypothetical protein
LACPSLCKGEEFRRVPLYNARQFAEGFMAYIENSLGQGEVIVAKAHFHWWYTFKAILLACTIIGLIFAIPMLIRKWTTEIGVTTHRFVEKTGLASLHTYEIALPNIEGLKVGSPSVPPSRPPSRACRRVDVISACAALRKTRGIS